ncbi:hypothetical protein acsn021_13070 [Anaerocolumna cellulosilytica]|uniref:Uncharacterized protein n=1 Tax=Anaerocolumna cellulosilytica TaxID=433286 RepID=A0A6S6R3W3_9FIRM|nr:hypothetical protein [Anaerocolumna cellulosilytica]MBB5195964.1 hypothetical protein [Anaerocolumna cellulosilytica]BCJ93738.1 hypothetical protein acsn021_13070 [Anaerocolumna cellulosilytica]
MLIQEGLFSHATIDRNKEYLVFQGSCFYDGIVKCMVLEENLDTLDYEVMSIGCGIMGKLSGKIPIMKKTGIYNFQLWLEDTAGEVLETVQILHVTIKDNISNNLSVPEIGRNSIELERITYHKDCEDNKALIILTYKNVADGLCVKDAAKGFHIKLAPRLMDYGQITEVHIEGNKIMLKTAIAYQGPNDVSSAFLSYKYPAETQNIITDSQGRYIPEMDMVRVVSEGFLSPYMNVWQISISETLNEDFRSIGYPWHLSEKDYKEVQFPGWYCEVPEELCCHGEEAVIYFAGYLMCEERENFCLHAGSCDENKLKLWFDNIEVMYTDNSNQGAAKLFIEPGIHEILFAVNTMGGKAAGIYARLEKLTYPGDDGNIVKTHPKFPVFIRKDYVKNFQ